MQPQGNINTGCRESTIVACAVITVILGVLAFFGIRQYTDLFGPARSRNPKPTVQTTDGESSETNQPTPETNQSTDNQSPELKIVIDKWLKMTTEPQEITTYGDYSSTERMLVRVEAMGINGDSTVIRLAFKNGTDDRVVYLQDAAGAYIADSDGNVYDLVKDGGSYPFDSLRNSYHRAIRIHEIYRYVIVFPRIPSNVPFVYLHHPRFSAIKINLNWD